MGIIWIIICLIPTLRFFYSQNSVLFILALIVLFINIVSYLLMRATVIPDAPDEFQSPQYGAYTLTNMFSTIVGLVLLIISFFIK